MLSRLKEEAMRQGMRLLSNPKVAKMMADPRFLNAITRGMEFKGRVQSELDDRVRSMASLFNLVTQEELDAVKRELRDMEARYEDLKRRTANTTVS